ncbi:DUF5937 family protein [Streptomyces sp. 372A]
MVAPFGIASSCGLDRARRGCSCWQRLCGEGDRFIERNARQGAVVELAEQSVEVGKLRDNATSAQGTGLTFPPSVFGRPHLMVVHAPGWQPLVQ